MKCHRVGAPLLHEIEVGRPFTPGKNEKAGRSAAGLFCSRRPGGGGRCYCSRAFLYDKCTNGFADPQIFWSRDGAGLWRFDVWYHVAEGPGVADEDVILPADR
jgi:hypothetical protein